MSSQLLSCPSCAGKVALRSDATETLVCPSCGVLCDVTARGLVFVAPAGLRRQPDLPLGVTGELFGDHYELIGWVMRACTVDSEEYAWSEYLLQGEHGYRWLSECEGHWIFLEPLSASQVSTTRWDQPVRVGGVAHRHFQRSERVGYKAMQGEFYWQIRSDDVATLDDYIAPSRIACREAVAGDVQWTLGQHVLARELWRSFKAPGSPPRQYGVGPCQPNLQLTAAPRMLRQAGLFGALLIAVAVLLSAALPRASALTTQIELSPSSPIYLSPVFEITSSTHAAELEARVLGDLREVLEPGTSEAWLGVDMALIEDRSGKSDAISFDLYQPLDGSASEGELEHSERVGSIQPGRYLLRVESTTPPSVTGSARLQVSVTHGVFLWFPLWLALGLIAVAPLVVFARGHLFERRRWEDSDYPGGSSEG
ncbi:MAG TPA: DUF4178 domain-containing protein [Polyangiales bacterium]|nr:DUF4178 domain-containing protein [Polyangiales bacterium]